MVKFSKHTLDLDFVLGLEKGAGDMKDMKETCFPALEGSQGGRRSQQLRTLIVSRSGHDDRVGRP